MIRIPGWILGLVLTAAIAACGAGDPSEDPAAQPEAAAPARPQPQPRAEAPAGARPAREAPTTGPAPAVSQGRLYTVQVGAFDTADEAELWAGRLARLGYPTWTTTAVVDGRTYHRLRVGASPSVSETRRLGAIITREFHWPFWVAPIEDNGALPENAVARTHALASGS
ncbi:MAG TPA: SPOR domain-containing protein [Longimicrobiales bacterium]